MKRFSFTYNLTAAIKRGCVAILFLLSLVLGCYDDKIGATIENENTKSEDPIGVVPVPGNSGFITTSEITETSVRLSWERATDDTTPQYVLQYRVYYSMNPDIDTKDGVLSHGTPYNVWSADLTGIDVTGLTPGATYYFNVLVKDDSDNAASYIMVAITTSGGTSALYLFGSGVTTQGNFTATGLTPRQYADKACKDSTAYAALPCSNTRAFISVSETDCIKKMPGNYGVPITRAIKGPEGGSVASGWSALFTTLPDTFAHLGVINGFWWSGSTVDDAGNAIFDSDNSCGGWTSSGSGDNGMVGAHNETAYPTWMRRDGRNCTDSHEILCVCW